MKRLYIERMLGAPATVETPDVVALPRCACGSRRWTFDLGFGTGHGKRALGYVDATCTQCGAIGRVHDYRGRAAYAAAFSHHVTSRTNQAAEPAQRRASDIRATALVGHATN